jgi:molybdate/tungstate transport system permease protein
MHRDRLIYWIFSVLGSLILLFIIAPLAGMFLSTNGIDIINTAKEKEVQDSIILTLSSSFFGTLFFSLLAIPLAYVLARKKFFGKNLISAIIDLPIIIPHSAAGIAVLGFISRDSFLGKAADSIGIDFVGNPIGISIAMAFVSIPYLINAARDGFMAVPERLEHAAYNLGKNRFYVFLTISIPLSWRNIISGFILMFARGLSEFGAVVIVAYHPMITPVMIYERFTTYGLNYARPVSIVFISVCLIFFVLLRLLNKEKAGLESKNGKKR